MDMNSLQFDLMSRKLLKHYSEQQHRPEEGFQSLEVFTGAPLVLASQFLFTMAEASGKCSQ